jgi:glycosyltransferase involved in cell wall biosynthesis
VLTVLMPAYNEEAGLADAVVQVLAALDACGVSAELLLVNDGSTDHTGQIADALAGRRPEVRAVHHASNLGIGAGMRTGMAAARGQRLILIPADLALDLSELCLYLETARRADVVVGICPDRRDYSRFRRVVSWANTRLIQALFRMPLRQFNYISMYPVDYLRRIEVRYWSSAFFFAEILIKLRAMGARLEEVDITYAPRTSGRATGANVSLIAATGRDMLEFWFHWVLLGERNRCPRLSSPAQDASARNMQP